MALGKSFGRTVLREGRPGKASGGLLDGEPVRPLPSCQRSKRDCKGDAEGSFKARRSMLRNSDCKCFTRRRFGQGHPNVDACVSAGVWKPRPALAHDPVAPRPSFSGHDGLRRHPGEPTTTIRQHHYRETNLPKRRSWRDGRRHRHAQFPARQQVCPKDAPVRPPFRSDAARLTRC